MSQPSGLGDTDYRVPFFFFVPLMVRCGTDEYPPMPICVMCPTVHAFFSFFPKNKEISKGVWIAQREKIIPR
jgi:hypothetical protein